jgi:hypothetical protein
MSNSQPAAFPRALAPGYAGFPRSRGSDAPKGARVAFGAVRLALRGPGGDAHRLSARPVAGPLARDCFWRRFCPGDRASGTAWRAFPAFPCPRPADKERQSPHNGARTVASGLPSPCLRGTTAGAASRPTSKTPSRSAPVDGTGWIIVIVGMMSRGGQCGFLRARRDDRTADLHGVVGEPHARARVNQKGRRTFARRPCRLQLARRATGSSDRRRGSRRCGRRHRPRYICR